MDSLPPEILNIVWKYKGKFLYKIKRRACDCQPMLVIAEDATTALKAILRKCMFRIGHHIYELCRDFVESKSADIDMLNTAFTMSYLNKKISQLTPLEKTHVDIYRGFIYDNFKEFCIKFKEVFRLERVDFEKTRVLTI